VEEGGVELLDGLPVDGVGVGAEGRVADVGGPGPAGGDVDDLVVEARGPGAVEREAPGEDHPLHRVVAREDTRAGEVVEDEALREEAPEQPPRHRVLQVEVDHRPVERARVAEHHRPERRLAPPLAG